MQFEWASVLLEVVLFFLGPVWDVIFNFLMVWAIVWMGKASVVTRSKKAWTAFTEPVER